MQDVSQSWGADLQVGSGGDLGLADNATGTRQRLLRRLLTNPGDYIWHPEYGAGLGRFVGRVVDVSQLQAIVRLQMAGEPTISRSPEPVIEVTPAVMGTSFYLTIQYSDVSSVQNQTLELTLSR